MIRLGYIVPEFPGQTHIFFWRELQSLADLGVECDLVSTRRPAKQMMSHSWSTQAMERTTYLSPMTFASFLPSIGAIMRSGPAGWWRIWRAVATSRVGGMKARTRLVGLAVAGGEVAAMARRRSWRHLHVHSCADSAHVAMFAHLICNIPYSLTLHGPLEDYGPNQAMKWSHAAFCVVITRGLLAEVRATLDGAAPREIDVAPMGVNVTTFRRVGNYQPWDGQGPFRIFSCGRLNPCKGHDDLIAAIALLRDRGIDAQLEIAGADDSLGRYQPMLGKEIAELKLSERVKLLGAVSEERVREGLEKSHVFALASLHEPLGVAIMEAMAMEMPVVATRAGGVPELIDERIDGILVEPRNRQDLARGLETVARDADLARKLAAAAREKVTRSFQSDQSAKVLARHLGK
jgi:glycosyltransferase involved in cell wall biosynthesis